MKKEGIEIGIDISMIYDVLYDKLPLMAMFICHEG